MGTPDITKIAVLEGKVTGAIFVAPATTPLPTDATTALPAEYKCLGFTSDDGIVITEDGSTKQLRVWEGNTVARTQKTEYNEQIKFTPVECSEDVAKFTWGDDKVSVDTSGNLTIKHHGQTMMPVHTVIEAVPSPVLRTPAPRRSSPSAAMSRATARTTPDANSLSTAWASTA
ncbi:MAG: hypothetical protein ACLUE1_07550 [Adlercreutzia equolifaciens]